MRRPPTHALLVALTVILLGYIAYSKRLPIAAVVWHWKNGDFVRIDNYEVPVPKHWLVKGDSSGLFIIDTLPSGDTRTLSGINVITIDSLPTPTRDLEFWISYKQKWLKQKGISIVEERSLTFGDEVVACLGGHELHELTQLPDVADMVSLECRSSGKLHLIFVGQEPDLQLFYSMIPKIRRRK